MATELETIDLRGLKCPLPVLKSRKYFKSLSDGDVVVIETTDPLAVIDIPAFCLEDGHDLINSEADEGINRFRIRVTKLA